MKPPKPSSAKKSAPPSKTTTPKPPRKNARRYDIDPTDHNGTVLSTRVSKAMKDRAMAASRAMGCSNHSELLGYALVRLFNQLPEIMDAYGRTGVLPMKLAAMNDFKALPLAREEVEYARRWVPEKVERLDMKRIKIEKTLNHLLERLMEVERHLKMKGLELPPEEEPLPMRVEVDLI